MKLSRHPFGSFHVNISVSYQFIAYYTCLVTASLSEVKLIKCQDIEFLEEKDTVLSSKLVLVFELMIRIDGA